MAWGSYFTTDQRQRLLNFSQPFGTWILGSSGLVGRWLEEQRAVSCHVVFFVSSIIAKQWSPCQNADIFSDDLSLAVMFWISHFSCVFVTIWTPGSPNVWRLPSLQSSWAVKGHLPSWLQRPACRWCLQLPASLTWTTWGSPRPDSVWVPWCCMHECDTIWHVCTNKYYYKIFRQSCVVRFIFGEVLPQHLITYYNGWFIRKPSVRCQVQGGNLNSSFVVEGMAIARRLDSQTPRKLVDGGYFVFPFRSKFSGFESGLSIQRCFFWENLSAFQISPWSPDLIPCNDLWRVVPHTTEVPVA